LATGETLLGITELREILRGFKTVPIPIRHGFSDFSRVQIEAIPNILTSQPLVEVRLVVSR